MDLSFDSVWLRHACVSLVARQSSRNVVLTNSNLVTKFTRIHSLIQSKCQNTTIDKTNTAFEAANTKVGQPMHATHHSHGGRAIAGSEFPLVNIVGNYDINI